MTYADLLRDPRWQKKRLEIMQRDGFQCRFCSDDKSTLNVHHCFYERGKAPWEYPNASLVTFCEDCHEMQRSMEDCAGRFISLLRRLGVSNSDFDSFIASLGILVGGNTPLAKRLDEVLLKFAHKIDEEGRP